MGLVSDVSSSAAKVTNIQESALGGENVRNN